MGRLFWKIFWAFWLTLLLVVSMVTVALVLHEEAHRPDSALAGGPRAGAAVWTTAAVLHGAGRAGVASLFGNWPIRETRPPLIVDDRGQDMLGRTVAPDMVVLARSQLQQEIGSHHRRRVAEVKANDGAHYLVFLPTTFILSDEGLAHELWGLEWPLSIVAAAAVASLLVGVLLARHFSAPIRDLRDAFAAVKAGDLGVRVSPGMGQRRDEIAQLGREFDAMAAQLQQLIGSQHRLLHDVSHELRSPLARLQVAVGLARQKPEQLERSLSRIERESERLDALVGEVLTLSRLESSVPHAGEEWLDVLDLLNAAVDDARFEAEAEGGSRRIVTHGLEHALPLNMRAQGELLLRTFDNILRNALRYTPAGSQVDVSLSRTPEAVEICFADRGPGVAGDQLEAIFEPFFRLREGGQGHGLGLAIARRAVEAHQGKVAARNRAGGGLEICIHLPVPAGR